ncbi:MAG: HEAT repeat domain-containing protein [Planctomycetes bacterium]|nr:HEAT repeat domain-containing protein [Planctomycetota bacterium]
MTSLRPLLLFLVLALPALAGRNLPARFPEFPAKMPPAQEKRILEVRRPYQVADEEARIRALDAYDKLQDPDADNDLVVIACADGHPEVRLRAIEILIAHENSSAGLCAARLALSALPPAYRKRAVAIVRKLGNAAAEEALAHALKKGFDRAHPANSPILNPDNNRIDDAMAQVAAAIALGELRTPKAVDALLAALGDGDWQVRSTAARALGEAGDVRAVDALLRTAKDEDLDVRIESIISLGRFGGAPAIAALRRAAGDKEPIVARFAARALKLAQAPRPAAPAAGTSAETPSPPAFESDESGSETVYIVDDTFSMTDAERAVRGDMENVWTKEDETTDKRVGFVLYRDFGNAFTTRQMLLSYDMKKARRWFNKASDHTGAESSGAAIDRAFLVAMYFNWSRIPKKTINLYANGNSNDDEALVFYGKLLHQGEGVTVNSWFRIFNSRKLHEALAEAGGGTATIWTARAPADTRRGGPSPAGGGSTPGPR